VFDSLGFTVSAGIAASKLLAKIGSSRNKPNKQTLVPVLASPLVLRTLPLRGIPGLGGKAGRIVEQKLKAMLRATNREPRFSKSRPQQQQQQQKQQQEDVEQPTLCGQVQDAGEDALCEMFPGDEAFGRSIFKKCLGLSDDKVEHCVRPKSLLSMKSLRVEDRDKLDRLLLLLAQDLVSRLDEDQSMFRRRAKTLVVHHRKPGSFVCATVRGRLPRAVAGGSHSSSSSTGIPDARAIVDAAIKLMESRLKAHLMLPCTRMGLSAETFEDLPDEKAAITKFFSTKGTASGRMKGGAPLQRTVLGSAAAAEAESASVPALVSAAAEGSLEVVTRKSVEPVVSHEELFFLCPKCKKRIRIAHTEEHMDFHFAQEVQGQLTRAAAGGRNPQERLAAHDRDRNKDKKRKKKGSLFAAFAKQARSKKN
jgi:nucleotidyltransferase/DNA polymerase involved in DNA repair